MTAFLDAEHSRMAMLQLCDTQAQKAPGHSGVHCAGMTRGK